MVMTKCLGIEYVPFVQSNAIVLRRIASEFGVLPHELLRLNILDFNFDLAVLLYSDRKVQEIQKGISPDNVEKNKFAKKKGTNQFTHDEFEQAFGKCFTK